MKKNIFVILCTLASSSLFSNGARCEPCDPCEPQTIEGLFNPSSRFDMCPRNDLIVTGDFLLWTAKEGGLFYLQTGQHTGTDNFAPANATDFSGFFKKIRTQWDTGFRVGLGYPISHDQWDANVYYVHYTTDKHSSQEGLSMALWAHTHPKSDKTNFGFRRTTQAHAKWDFDYNMLDFEIGRAFWVSTKLSLKPYIGVRGGWIDQTFKIHYNFYSALHGTGDTKAISDFSGAGPRSGVDFRYLLAKGFSILAKGSYALLYGKFEADYKESESEIHEDESLLASATDDFHLGTSVMDFSFGLGWDKITRNEKLHFGLFAGWEEQVWLHFNHMNHFGLTIDDTNSYQEEGNLSLQGLTVRAQLQF